VTENEAPLYDDRAAALARWLSQAGWRLDPRFPREIEAAWQAESASGRMRRLRAATLVSCLVCLLMTPLLWGGLPGAHAAIRLWWLGAALPVGAARFAVLWTRLDVLMQECQAVAGAMVIAVCFTAIAAAGGSGQGGFFCGGMLLMMMLETVAGRLSAGAAAVLVAGLLAVFAGGLGPMVQFGGAAMLAQTGILAVCAGCALFGTWRLETEMRRGFAQNLRDRLAHGSRGRQGMAPSGQAGCDPLTSLANRHTYEHWLATQWSGAAHGGGTVGLVLIDVDGFSGYNDYYGATGGDACLQAVARCVREQCRGTTDHVARIGGQAFAVLLPGLALEVAGDVAERVRSAVAAADMPHLGGGVGRRVTVSCGAASFRAVPGARARDLCDAADAALRQAVQGGRNQVCLAEQPEHSARNDSADGPRNEKAWARPAGS
jgi:diguanylate cyclase (GGDEF)-like protein